MSDRDGEHQLSLSQSFRGASNISRHRTEERVTLFVYGIAPVGNGIILPRNAFILLAIIGNTITYLFIEFQTAGKVV